MLKRHTATEKMHIQWGRPAHNYSSRVPQTSLPTDYKLPHFSCALSLAPKTAPKLPPPKTQQLLQDPHPEVTRHSLRTVAGCLKQLRQNVEPALSLCFAIFLAWTKAGADFSRTSVLTPCTNDRIVLDFPVPAVPRSIKRRGSVIFLL